mgnify:FL=1
MESQINIHSHHAEKVEVTMYTSVEEVEKRLLRGRVLLDSDRGELMFAQNEPRLHRSKEVMRTEHGRLVRRPDGLYTFTFSKVDVKTKFLRELLLTEVRQAATAMVEDRKRIEDREKVEARKQNVKKGGEE